MAWKINFSDRAEKQLKKIDKPVVRRILKFLKTRVESDPKSTGKFLKGKLSDLWSYRVGDYRLICSFQDDELIVLVLEVGHRREVYKDK